MVLHILNTLHIFNVVCPVLLEQLEIVETKDVLKQLSGYTFASAVNNIHSTCPLHLAWPPSPPSRLGLRPCSPSSPLITPLLIPPTKTYSPTITSLYPRQMARIPTSCWSICSRQNTICFLRTIKPYGIDIRGCWYDSCYVVLPVLVHCDV